MGEAVHVAAAAWPCDGSSADDFETRSTVHPVSTGIARRDDAESVPGTSRT